MSVSYEFGKELATKISALGTLHAGFQKVFFNQKRFEDNKENDGGECPYVVFTGELLYETRSHESEFYRGTYTFSFYHTSGSLASAMATVFRDNFMHEEVFRTFALGKVIDKFPQREAIELVDTKKVRHAYPVIFRVAVPRVNGTFPAVYS